MDTKKIIHQDIWQQVDSALIEKAILIRQTEKLFLDLFSQGKLNGTVHTCIGQEFSGLAFAGQVSREDYVISNHRCHGHYLSYTEDLKGLIAELMGKSKGTCGGIGSSQHLCHGNFFSNGVQGSIVPVALGVGLSLKLRKSNGIVIVYIGDGTLGEGVVYETLNMASLWGIPLLIVCEHNYYSQSTPTETTTAGTIEARALAFNIQVKRSCTENPEQLMRDARESISYVREHSKPFFHIVETYRLGPHSKGDDTRDPAMIQSFWEKDPLYRFSIQFPDKYQKLVDQAQQKIDVVMEDISEEKELELKDYLDSHHNIKQSSLSWVPMNVTNKRVMQDINQFFQKKMKADSKVLFIGEDVLSPYGGAFKIAQGLSYLFPNQVISTPLSEACIVGMGNGLALEGQKPFVEIMFGDFVTLAFDQIINGASKFFHMYNHQKTCPLVVRMPMGARRGYGPTHSQSLEKHLLGIDNVRVVALNCLVPPSIIYEQIYQESHPVLVIENKLDYAREIGARSIPGFKFEYSNERYPIARIYIGNIPANITLVTYGGMVDYVIEAMKRAFIQHEIFVEALVVSEISPLDMREILRSVVQTKKIVTVEEGSGFFGFGSEVIAALSEKMSDSFSAKRVAALSVPIPSCRTLEDEVIPSVERILEAIEAIARE